MNGYNLPNRAVNFDDIESGLQEERSRSCQLNTVSSSYRPRTFGWLLREQKLIEFFHELTLQLCFAAR
jgi:hypothetical protein